jgi:hypothetical protein
VAWLSQLFLLCAALHGDGDAAVTIVGMWLVPTQATKLFPSELVSIRRENVASGGLVGNGGVLLVIAGGLVPAGLIACCCAALYSL